MTRIEAKKHPRNRFFNSTHFESSSFHCQLSRPLMRQGIYDLLTRTMPIHISLHFSSSSAAVSAHHHQNIGNKSQAGHCFTRTLQFHFTGGPHQHREAIIIITTHSVQFQGMKITNTKIEDSQINRVASGRSLFRNRKIIPPVKK